ncbi:MAG: orotidine 5'-phosphate decarboxylase [Alphaproteobacteria bacterium]|nr:MAG: orotidine 5'-phosphate decarboxylase [Alphaproteobacteria bacterium]
MSSAVSRVFVALDTTSVADAVDRARAMRGAVAGVKLGLEFFSANGPAGVRQVVAEGLPLFLDLKFHDIPNTVAGAVRAVTPLGPFMLNVHAAGGAAMMRAALDASADTAAKVGVRRPRLIAVTVLTSLGDDDLAAIGQQGPAFDQVRRLAALAQEAGLDGVVCSPQEIEPLRRDCGSDFVLVTPGIRPAGAAAGDQKRVMTPAEAVRRGAHYLVIGRPITAAEDPAAAARAIAADIDRDVA